MGDAHDYALPLRWDKISPSRRERTMIRIQTILLSAALLLTGSLACRAAETPEPPAKSVAITNVRIFFGTKTISKGILVIQGTDVYSAGVEAHLPPGAEVI